MLVLCVIGGWSIWKWYHEGTVRENLQLMIVDLKEAADTVITDQGDRAAVDEKIAQIREIVGKYTER